MTHQITLDVGTKRHVTFGGTDPVEATGGDSAIATFDPDDDSLGGTLVGVDHGSTEFVFKRGGASAAVHVVVGEGADELIQFSADEPAPVENDGPADDVGAGEATGGEGGADTQT